MSLTKAEANEMVNAVLADAESLRRIREGNIIADKVPDSLGISGSIRNWGYVACNIATGGSACDPREAEYAESVCTGIADQTAKAISEAAKCRVLLASRLEQATVLSRLGFMGTDHTATHIIMVDKTEYVFDWHATLNPRNPMIHKAADWKRSTGGVLFAKFTGF